MVHILLVEDNPADVLMIREALRESPIAADVTIAYDGEQAVRLMEQIAFKPDFIMLDLNIPKLDGLQLLERYHSEGSPIIVFTSSSKSEDKRRALAGGARDYVIKPTGFGAFTSAVQGILERWGKAERAAT